VGPKKHVLDRVHIGATWQNRMNHPSAAVIRPFCQIMTTLLLLLLLLLSLGPWGMVEVGTG